jgi:hypothetical protein
MLRGRKESTFRCTTMNPASRVKAHVFIRLFCVLIAAASALAVTEHEPNNTSVQANAVQCGDTVVCAVLSSHTDYDFFRFHAFAGDSIIVFTTRCEGSNTDTYMNLFDEQDSSLEADDDGGEEHFSMIRWAAQYSGNYFVRVVWFVTAEHDSAYNLIIQCPRWVPDAYDSCRTARVISALPYYDEGSTQGAHSECGTLSPDVFYRFHNPAEDDLEITVCSDHFNSKVQLMGGCCTDPMDDADTGCNLGAFLPVFSLPMGDYYIMVEGTAANQVGSFSIEVTAHLSDCPKPDSVKLFTVGGYPFLDWPELTGPTFYIVWAANYANGVFEHLGTTTETYYVDSTGYNAPRRFYQVTAVCPW